MFPTLNGEIERAVLPGLQPPSQPQSVSVTIVMSNLFLDALPVTKHPTIDTISGFEGRGQHRASHMLNTQSPITVRFPPLGKKGESMPLVTTGLCKY